MKRVPVFHSRQCSALAVFAYLCVIFSNSLEAAIQSRGSDQFATVHGIVTDKNDARIVGAS